MTLSLLTRSVLQFGRAENGLNQSSYQSEKGDSLDCNNYRTNTLLARANKILLPVILECKHNKLQKLLTTGLGFRACRGACDQQIKPQVFSLNPLYTCFINFTKALDMISHDQLWLSMLDIDFPLHLFQLLHNVQPAENQS